MANTMRFLVILGDDRASSAFDRFARSVDRSNASVTRNTAALRRNQQQTDSARKSFGGLLATITGLGDAQDAASRKASLMARAWAVVNLATGVLESSVSALIVTAGGVAAAFTAGAVGLGAYGLAAKPLLSTVAKLNQLQTQAAAGSKTAKKQLDQLLKTTPPQVVKFAVSVKAAQGNYDRWAKSLAAPVLAPLSKALGLVNPLLHDLTPFVVAASGALTVLIGKLGRGIQSTGFHQWLATILPLVKPTIVGVGVALGNVAVGLGGALRAFAPFALGVVGGLDKLTAKFRQWGATLDQHSGFKALVAQWRNNWPVVRQGLTSLLTILTNVGRAMAGIATPSNSRTLWQVANPLLALAASLSSHPAVVQALLYILLIGKGSGQVKTAFDAVKSGWGGITKFLALVTGGKVQLGMQGAGDTMLTAATRMQAAADTMAAASRGGAAVGGAEAGTAATAGAATASIGRIVLRAGLGALVIPATAMIVGSFIPKDKSRQVAADLRKQPPILVKITDFLHVTGMAGWVDQYFSHPVRAWAENSLPHFLATARHNIAGAFDQIRHTVAATWDTTWNNTIGRVNRFAAADAAVMGRLRGSIATKFDQIRHDVAATWNTIWANTIGRARAGINDTVGWFARLQGRVIGALTGLGHRLYAFARAALSEFLSGFRSISGSVLSWVAGFVKNIWSKVKSFFGINSPSSLFYDIGKNLMLGLFHGIKDHAGKVQGIASQISGGLGGGFPGGGSSGPGAAAAQRYAASILRLYGWSKAQMAYLVPLWNQESGWRWNALNPSSGAYGIPQSLPASKMAAAGADWRTNPATQIRWGLGYIRGRYGSPAGAWAHERAFNWYGAGGPVNEPVLGIGQRTGQPYGFGEAGAEYVTSQADMKQILAAILAQNGLLASLVKQGSTHPERTGRALALALNTTTRHVAAH